MQSDRGKSLATTGQTSFATQRAGPFPPRCRPIGPHPSSAFRNALLIYLSHPSPGPCAGVSSPGSVSASDAGSLSTSLHNSPFQNFCPSSHGPTFSISSANKVSEFTALYCCCKYPRGTGEPFRSRFTPPDGYHGS